MTEIERMKDAIKGVFGDYIGCDECVAILRDTAINAMDCAYALGKSERGEKMPIRIVEREKCCYWKFDTDDPTVWGELDGTAMGPRELAIDRARKFWGKYGVDIEIVGEKE